MSRVGGRLESALDLAKERLLAHDPEHPLVVNRPPSPVELLGDPTISVARKLEYYPLYGVPQLDILGGFLLGVRALVVPGATHLE